MKFPNYLKNENSPEINFSQPGIALFSLPVIKLGNSPIFPLYGCFNIPEKFASEFNGHLMEAVVILLRGPNPVTKSVGRNQIFFKDDLSKNRDSVYGFFNIDLFSFFNLLQVPNRYYVSASIFDYISEVLTIDILE